METNLILFKLYVGHDNKTALRFKEELICNLVDRFFEGYTLIKTEGYYLGNKEKSYLIEIVTHEEKQVNKLKALMYCEFRLYQLSKAISLEALRIKKKKYSKVKNILKNLSSIEKKGIIQKNINEKKRGENILKVQKLEKQQKENAQELDKLIQKKTDNVNNK